MPAIAMGALGVAQGDQVLRTLLGSCLGLALYDRRLKLGGLAHIVLPKAPAGPCELPGKFVDTAVPALIRKMEALADGTALKLWAKIAMLTPATRSQEGRRAVFMVHTIGAPPRDGLSGS